MVEAVAAVTPAANAAFELRDVVVSDPGPGEVLVDIRAVGICHTDLVLASGAFGNAFPAVFGHEGAGIVAAVGAGVTRVAPGDKVVLTFNSCGACAACRADEPAYCEQFLAANMACARADGSSRLHDHGHALSDNCFGQSSFASKAIAAERTVVKLDDDADLAALAPFGCSIQTGVGAVLRSLAARSGQSLLVFGGGAVGLSAVLGGVIAGCAPIVVVEPQAGRREIALKIGATHAVDPGEGDLAATVRAILPGGADLVVDTSGNAVALAAAIDLIASRGKLGMVGLPGAMDAALPVPIVQWMTKGGTVRGIVEGDSDPVRFLPELAALHRAGRLPIEHFVTAYPFAQINQAVADAHSGTVVKAVLTL